MLNVEWDDLKNQSNIIKHRLSFEDAILVFYDENRLEYFDEIHSITEDRFITIGMVNQVICVVYTERNSKIRLISARLATAAERRDYYASINGNY